MSDASWLKFLGGTRARAPGTLSSPRSEPTLRALHRGEQEAEEPHSPQHGVKAQLSSWHNKIRTTSTSLEIETSPENCHFAKAGEITWHTPSFDQMAEALQVRMMTKPLMDPLPLEYHSHILHVIEGYGLLKTKAVVAEQELAEAQNRHDKEQEKFNLMQESWIVQEARYKAEIKRLEILIHQSSDSGLEAVAVARSESLLRPQNHHPACLARLEVVDETSQGGVEETLSRGRSLGHQSSILSRPRIVDVNSDIRLSKRLIRQDKAKSLERRCARGRKDGAANRKTPVDAHRSESNSSGTASRNLAPPEDTRDIHDSKVSKEARGGDVCTLQSDPSARKQMDAKLFQYRHRREFSFVPGDDMAGTHNIARPRESPDATTKREYMDPRLEDTLVGSNSAKDGPVDGGKSTAERY